MQLRILLFCFFFMSLCVVVIPIQHSLLVPLSGLYTYGFCPSPPPPPPPHHAHTSLFVAEMDYVWGVNFSKSARHSVSQSVSQSAFLVRPSANVKDKPACVCESRSTNHRSIINLDIIWGGPCLAEG